MKISPNSFNRRHLLAAAIALISTGGHAAETASTSRQGSLEVVEVTGHDLQGSYIVESMSTATKFGLSAFETPQSVSVVTAAQIQDFNLNSLNDVLMNTTGINAEEVETDRIYYTARGFDITNFQYDGMGLQVPDGNISGDIDTYVYDRVEVVRGPNGLMAGAGNPSATINMVRKRPTDEFIGQVGASAGSYDEYRLEGDVSGRLSDRVRGRLVVATEDNGSYLDRYGHDKKVAYGVIDIALTDSTLFTAGYTWQENKADSPLWGAAPLLYTDGTQTDFKRSTSTAPDWAFWNSTEVQAFAEIAHTFDSGWEVKGTYTYIDHEEDSEMLYYFGTPDKITGLGGRAYGSDYTEDNGMDLFDLYASGTFQLAGREHELVLGYSWSESTVDNFSYYDDSFPPLPEDFRTWNGGGVDLNLRRSVRGGADYKDEQESIYAATRLNLTDDLKILLGARVSDWKTTGSSYSVSKESKYSGVTTPYAGIVYSITDTVSFYSSYTDIFTQQTAEDINGSRLDPLEGRSHEAGIKAQLADGKLLFTLAAFDIEQTNLAISGPDNSPVTGTSYYIASDGISSEGFEIELAGQVTEGLEMSLGYTNLDMDANDQQDKNVLLFTPSQTLRLSSSYRLQSLPDLKVGASLKWQDDTSRVDSGFEVQQDSYALIDLFASYDLTEQVNVSLNVKNITNEKYLTSLYWGQGYYGAPTTATASVNLRF
ncbi:TonB-dependent siderophore receptor [Aestuariicella sp. G3-2]|uniref:TonB-dependent siderophore receptor n=1 Tax=Pseudomaricurvus albidus TaxID=2842452 RepID=UPI001C0B5D5D|nr:TonB-dependent siderophore receptor [Aestuariicella albida]MBU3069168.1 TonB-dependent siderophore receptor [Aestuariicella albida]